MRVAGIDGWKRRWAIIILVDGKFAEAHVADDLGEFLTKSADVEAIGIDMPIGLPTSGIRRADSEARKYVAGRSSSVFSAPPRDVLSKPDYQAANQHSRKRHGRGISKQAYNLKPKIDEVAGLVAKHPKRMIGEVHPEVSFRCLNEQPLSHSKKTWLGQRQRFQALESAGVVLPDELGALGSAPVDDILDATVAAWTADRMANGVAETLPAEPKQNEPVIWY